MSIKPPPDRFRGTISEFVDEHVAPNFPPADTLLSWTEALLEYYDRPDAVHIIRGRAGGRGRPRAEAGPTVVEGDNSPGRWCYLRALDGTVRASEGELDSALDGGNLAILYAASKKEQEHWTYGNAMGSRDKKAFSAPQLKHCHIESALADAPPKPRVQALRNLCPVNHFLFRMPTKFAMKRVGWSEPRNPRDLGESEAVIAFVQHRLLEHLDASGRRVYRLFLDAVAGRIRELPEDRVVEIERKGTRDRVPESRRVSKGPGRRTRRSKGSKRPEGPPGSSDWWKGVLSGGRSNPRAEILDAVLDADARLEALLDNLTVEQLVGVANAMLNKCDPKDLWEQAPADRVMQAELGWGYPVDAKRSPRLGGKWARTVEALGHHPPGRSARDRSLSFRSRLPRSALVRRTARGSPRSTPEARRRISRAPGR